tara:strand:- start:1353 stop:2198 length:846 start_codon:yes stop_codon:yes gene_type:complete
MKILIVVVLYEKSIYNCDTIKSLKTNNLAKKKNYSLLVFDNSLKSNIEDSKSLDCEYYHSNLNKGVLGAYKYALKKANEKYFDWILMLDDDTTLPNDFLSKSLLNLNKVSNNDIISAVVPKIFDGNKLISPSRVYRGGIHLSFNKSFEGTSDKYLCAIGSCSIIRTSFINQIGGFKTNFILDCFDRWMFQQIHIYKKKVFVSNISVRHKLSIENYDKRMNLKRYQDILFNEDRFIKNHHKKVDYLIFKVRLFIRFFKLFIRYDNKDYAYLTFKFLFWKINP